MGNGVHDELIRKHDAIKAICEDGTWLERQGCTEITMAERKERDVDIIKNLPSANADLIQKIEEGIKATGTADEYSVGMCNGMKWCKSLLDGKEPKYDTVQLNYKKAFSVACELLIGASLFGVTEETMFAEIMERDGIVSSLGYEKYILDNLARLTGED